jgi:hypothetical protein
MRLESILNPLERHTCFVSAQVRFVGGLAEPELEVDIE